MILRFLHDAEEVAAPDLLDILLAIAAGKELTSEADELRAAAKTGDATVAIEIGTKTYMVDAHDIDSMLKMGNDIKDGGLPVSTEETGVDGGLGHTALGGKRAHLIVGEVARMVTEGTATRMAADDGHAADVEGIVETLLSSMTHIDKDAKTVHLTDDLFAKGADTTMSLIAT